MLEKDFKPLKNTTVLKEWFLGIKKNPFKSDVVEEEEEVEE